MNSLSFEQLAEGALEFGDRIGWLPPLLIRLFVGYFFFETGWAKAHDLAGFAHRFAQWGIPHPAFNAALSAYTELLGGALTVVGLCTRIVSIPMIINMAVAILAVNLKHVSGLNDFVELDEPLYALCYFWLMIDGPGRASLDYFIARALSRFSSDHHAGSIGSAGSVALTRAGEL
jgi:putative oxidoreductase